MTNTPLVEYSMGPSDGVGVSMVALSPDEERIAVSMNNGVAAIFSVKTREMILEYKYTQVAGNTSGGLFVITSCCFSPDGKTLLLTGGRGMRSINVENGQVKSEYIGPDEWTHSARCSSDGTKVMASSDDGSIWIWDARSGEAIRTLRGHKDMIHAACFSRDDCKVLSGSYDKTARLWDVKSGRELFRFEGHDDCVHSVGFSPDEKLLFSGSYDTTIRIWKNPTVE